MSDHKAYMERRGIYEVVKSWGWTAKTVDGHIAFHYPIWNEAGEIVSYRYKVDRDKNKNWWDGAKQAYYLPPGALDTIKEQKVVFFTEGEVDTATLHTMGITNAITWYSTTSLPATLPDDLKRWDVNHAIYIPDVDGPGLKCAVKFADLCEMAGIQYRVLRVPGEIGVDLNDAFIASNFQLDLTSLTNWTYQQLQRMVDYLSVSKRKLVQPGSEINPAVRVALESYALAQGGKETVVGGDRAIEILDPTGRHKSDSPGEHCYYFPDNPHAMDYAYCEWIKGTELCKLWGISEPFYLDIPEQTNGKVKPAPLPDDFVVSDLDILSRVYGYFRREPVVNPVNVVRTPIPVLWGFGGFCKAMTQGKILGLSAPSGVGKTIAAETMSDLLTGDGYNVLMWSGEWDTQEAGFRRVQRNGGASMNAVLEDQIARQMFAAGRDASDFAMMTDHTKAQARQVVNRIEGDIKSGAIGRVYTVNSAYNHYPVSQKLAMMHEDIRAKRAAGVVIHVVIMDYVQLLTNDPDYHGPNQSEHNLDLFKSFCIQMEVLGIVTTQVTKGATASAKQGNSLSGADMQWIREDKFNLLVSLQPVMVGDVELPYLELRIQKNSLGGRGFVHLEDTRKQLKFDFTSYVPPKTVREAIEAEKQRQELQDKKESTSELVM